MGCLGHSESENIPLCDINHDKTVYDTSETQNEDTKKLSKCIPQGTRSLMCCYGLGFVAVGLMSAGLAFAQALDMSVPHSQLNGFRFLSQLIITSPILIGQRRCDVRIERALIGWLLLAAVILTLMNYAHYGAVYYIPIGVATGLSCSLVLILNLTINCFVNKSFHWIDIVIAFVCVIGVAMVTQPQFMFHNYVGAYFEEVNVTSSSLCHRTRPLSSLQNTSAYDNTSDSYSSDKTTLAKLGEASGYILCICGTLMKVLYMQVVHKRLNNVNVSAYNFWVALFGCVSSFSVMGVTETPFIPTIPICLTSLVGHSITAATFTIISYKVFQTLDPMISSLILTLQIPVTFIMQYTLLAGIHPGQTNAVAICGAILVFLGNLGSPVFHVSRAWKKTKSNMESSVCDK